MSDNPFQPPLSETRVVGVLSGQREDLRLVAQYQKGILVCILIYLVAVFSRFALPAPLQDLLIIGVLLLGLVGTIFVFLLAMKIYGAAAGILLGLLTLIPCLGLLVLLIVNGRATATLRANNIKVGLLGANLADI